MIIEIRRHGDWSRDTGELTLESKKEAKRLSRNGKYKTVFSAEPLRCEESAEFISGKKPITSTAFDDIKPWEDIRKRTQSIMILATSSISFINASDKVLVLTHNNLIAAIECFLDGKEIPQNLDDLPVIPYLGGIQINISKQKI